MMGELETGQWTEALPLDDLWEGDMTDVTVEDRDVLLVNVDGEVHAFLNKCAHQAQKLSEGDLDGRVLTCPHHMWSFDATTGRGINPDDSQLVRLPCMIGDDDMIRVDVTE